MINNKEEISNPDIDIFLDITCETIRIPRSFKKIGEIPSKTGLFQYYIEGDNLISVRSDNSFALGEPKKGKFSIFFRKLDSSKPFFLNSLVLALKFRGLFALHSALLSKNNIEFLLVGESGSGKTTLAKNLSQKKFLYICDDICFLYRPDSRRVGVFLLLHKDFKNYHYSKLNLKKYEHIPSNIMGIHRKRYFPKFIIFPKITHSKISKLIPISKNEATIRLITLSQLMGIEEKEMVAEHVQLLKDLSTQCLCFELLASNDVEKSSNTLIETLRDLINDQKTNT
jgi:GTPase SAR1 family protein